MLALLMANLAPDVPPPTKREFRAAWVATVDNIDWPSKRGLPVETQKKELLTIIQTAASVNLNALILQVRPSCDALYPSKLEPWSEYLTGRQGLAPSPLWDPLQFAIEECHARGIELHAWLNPYRAWHPAATGSPAPNFIGKVHPELTKKYGKYQWLDPGEPAVQDHSFAVFMDLVNRYDLDGLHIDDYFYPYPEQSIDFPDATSYAAHGAGLNRADWRRQNVNRFVERVYKGIKASKPWVKFGISPFGIYRPGVPEGIKAGIDQYAELYADCKKWLNEGWCDYFTPQLYWPIGQRAQSYPVLLDYWVKQNKMGRHIWPGNFTSKLGENNPVWSAQEVIDQIAATRTTIGAGGNVHFSMKALTLNYKDIMTRLKSGPYAAKAFVPPSRWLAPNAAKLSAPKLQRIGSQIKVEPVTKAWMFAIYERSNNGWTLSKVTPATTLTLNTRASAVAVSVLDRYGNESPRSVIEL
jgi:uncharacterized lipoprotein YddW (UPF0748 family)